MPRIRTSACPGRSFPRVPDCRCNRAGTLFNLTYNQGDRLATVQQGSTTVANYGYDAFGQRLLKSLPGSPGTTILYQYDLAGHQIEDSDISSGSPSFQADYIYLGDRPVGLVLPGSGLLYYHDDRLGTPQLVTDGVGIVQWGGNYEPFGGVSTTGSITQNLRLPGQYADAETSWYNNGFRTYAPDVGRYIQVDPTGIVGTITSYSRTNPYVYALANPIGLIDPLGLDFLQCLGPLLTGQDAHNVLLQYLQSGQDGALWSGNTTFGQLFGTGRPDLIFSGTDPISVLELKPMGSAATGAARLERYLNTPGAQTIAGDTALIIHGSSLTLESQWFLGRTEYIYTPSDYPGVVTYSVTDRSVFQDIVRAFSQRTPGTPSPLPLSPSLFLPR